MPADRSITIGIRRCDCYLAENTLGRDFSDAEIQQLMEEATTFLEGASAFAARSADAPAPDGKGAVPERVVQAARSCNRTSSGRGSASNATRWHTPCGRSMAGLGWHFTIATGEVVTFPADAMQLGDYALAKVKDEVASLRWEAARHGGVGGNGGLDALRVALDGPGPFGGGDMADHRIFEVEFDPRGRKVLVCKGAEKTGRCRGHGHVLGC